MKLKVFATLDNGHAVCNISIDFHPTNNTEKDNEMICDYLHQHFPEYNRVFATVYTQLSNNVISKVTRIVAELC